MQYYGRRAGMAELVYAHDSKSCTARFVGSSPTSGTNIKKQGMPLLFCIFVARKWDSKGGARRRESGSRKIAAAIYA